MYNHELKDYKCPFCRLNGGIEDENVISKQHDIIYQDEFLTAFVGTHWWPHNPGSVIIVPNKHVENLYDPDDETGAKIFALSKKIAIAMKKEYKCDCVSTRQHNEPAGNQAVWHYHYHIIPRYTGDDLYINHKAKKFIGSEERKIWADKLKGKIV
jgi:histidine triad (HIT) family protein